MITIKKATLENLKTIQQLGFELLQFEHDRWDPTLDLNWPKSESGKAMYENAILNKYTILAYLDDTAVGYLIGTIQAPPKGSARSNTTAQLNNIYVNESARHTGVGHALAANFRQYCEENHVSNINVTVNAANTGAIAFYAREGFIQSRLIMTQELK